MNNIIIFDGQVFQTSAWDRGMGKYSFCLVDAILKELQTEDVLVYVVFTKNLALGNDAKRVIASLGPRVKHVYLDLVVPVSNDVTLHISNRSKNAIILDDFISTISYSEDSVKYIILSLFIDQICEVFPSKTENILLFYDLIPLFYYKYYSTFPTYQMYLAQFKSLLAADKIMTISQTVADELSGFIGIPKHKLCNIDGGPIKRDHIRAVKPIAFAVPDSFILMSTGNDMRKNNLLAVQGFEEYRLSSNNGDAYLIITSTFDEAAQHDLSMYSDHLIFTGNIPEGELLWLYQHMASLLFIPESEGLGLPILEAVEVNKPIVCSKIGPFYEMSENAFYYANHFDVADIADTITEAVSGYQWNEKVQKYKSIVDKYKWDKTAQKAVAFISRPTRVAAKKLRLAIVGPDPSGYSAIGKVMEQAHPVLSDYFDIDYYIEKQKSGSLMLRPSYIEYVASSRLVEQFDSDAYAKYDNVIYHIGNSEFHIETIKKALYLPGFAVIHDTYLENIFSSMMSGGAIAKTRYDAEVQLNKIVKSSETSMISSLLNNQLGAFVHSDFAKYALESLGLPDIKIEKTILATEVPVRERTRLSSKITLGLAGIIHPVKGMELVRKMAQLPEFESIQFEVFGMAMASPEDISKLSVLPNVNVSTNLSDYQFQLKLSQLDILVNYREEYHGETSLSVIEAMRLGVVPIVHDVGWYSELPGDAVVKLKSTRKLNQVILDLINNPLRLQDRSERAKQYVKEKLTYSRYVHDVLTMIDEGNKSKKCTIVESLKEGNIDRALSIIRQGQDGA